MEKQSIEKLLKKYSSIHGVSGFEYPVTQAIAKDLKDIGGFELSYDKLGSLTAFKKGTGKGPKVMLVAHVDEVGLTVSKITKEGFVRFTKIGGVWGHVLLAQRVEIVLDDGKTIDGLIGAVSPHTLKDEDKDKVFKISDMFVDLGLKSEEEVRKLGVHEGQQIAFKSEFYKMQNTDLVANKALDDRTFCAILVELAKDIKDMKLPCDLYIVFATQEEVGSWGAQTTQSKFNADVGLALDVCLATDHPNVDDTFGSSLGKGIYVSTRDRAMLANPRFVNFVEKIGQKHNFPVHRNANADGATDGEVMQRFAEGMIVTNFAIAQRYMHSHYGVVDLNDCVTSVKYLTELLKALDEKTYKEQIAFVV